MMFKEKYYMRAIYSGFEKLERHIYYVMYN